MEEIAIDDGAERGCRQCVAAAHQIFDLEAAILADGLQGGHDVGDVGAVGERQQQSLIGDEVAVDVVDLGDGVGGKAPGDVTGITIGASRLPRYSSR